MAWLSSSGAVAWSALECGGLQSLHVKHAGLKRDGRGLGIRQGRVSVRETPRGKGGVALKGRKGPRHPTGEVSLRGGEVSLQGAEVFLRATPRGKGGVSLEERKGHRHPKGDVALPGLPQRKGGVSSGAWLLQRWMTNTLDTEVIGAPDDG